MSAEVREAIAAAFEQETGFPAQWYLHGVPELGVQAIASGSPQKVARSARVVYEQLSQQTIYGPARLVARKHRLDEDLASHTFEKVTRKLRGLGPGERLIPKSPFALMKYSRKRAWGLAMDEFERRRRKVLDADLGSEDPTVLGLEREPADEHTAEQLVQFELALDRELGTCGGLIDEVVASDLRVEEATAQVTFRLLGRAGAPNLVDSDDAAGTLVWVTESVWKLLDDRFPFEERDQNKTRRRRAEVLAALRALRQRARGQRRLEQGCDAAIAAAEHQQREARARDAARKRAERSKAA